METAAASGLQTLTDQTRRALFNSVDRSYTTEHNDEYSHVSVV